MFRSITYDIKDYPYEYKGEQKLGYVIYRNISYFFGCYLVSERISICPDIEWLNESKKILGI